MSTPRPACRKPSRRKAFGVSLIEALLALVVMSLGMLAVVGVQATLRANGDLSRQRAEAVRLAQEALENWRAFTSVTFVPGTQDFTDIISDPPQGINITPAGANATYMLRRQVAPVPGSGSPPLRTFSTTVEWKDRAGDTQSVQLFSSIARVAPALAASLSVPPNGGPALRPLGRHVAIPRGAVMGTGGTSTFTPPQPAGAATVELTFDNLSGEITCVKDIVVGGPVPPVVPVAPCNPNDRAQLLTGTLDIPLGSPLPAMRVDYAPTPVPPPVPPQRATYTQSQACFVDLPQSGKADYYCVIRLARVVTQTPPWSGQVVFAPPAAPPLAPPPAPPACHYVTPSVPYPYAGINGPLSNQNFQPYPVGNACPAPNFEPA